MAGTVITIKDLIVHVQFDADAPDVNELLAVDNQNHTQLLVDHLEPGGIALCLNVRTDRSITKGMPVERTHKGIEIPIGDVTIGRIMDALGGSLDGQPAIQGPDVKYKDILKIPAR